MLMKGGNAVDAVLATAITLTVVEPTGNGIGSDAFAILWDGKKLHGLNASGRSPAAWTPDRFKGRTAMPDTRLGFRYRAGRGLRVGSALGTLRQAPLRRSFRAGDPLRVRGLHGVPRHRAPVGKAGALARARSGLCGAPHAARPGPGGGRAFRGAGAGESAEAHRRDERRGFLQRRARGKHGRARARSTAAR